MISGKHLLAAMILTISVDQFALSETATSGTAVIDKDQTSLDFDSTLLEGQMRAPDGFLLRGRMSQSMSEMVKLRSNFRKELIRSRQAVKAIAN